MKCFASSLTLLLAGCFSGLAAPVPPPEKLLPADTVAVFTIPEYGRASTAWKQWPASQLWSDTSLKPFKDKFVNKFQSDIVAPLEKEFGIKFADYADLAQGQFTIALTPNGWNSDSPKAPEFLFLLDSRDKSGALKTNLASLKNKWVDSGKQVRSDKIRDVEFTTLIFKSDDLKKSFKKAFPDSGEANEGLEPPKPDKPAENEEILIGQSDSLLIIGSAAKDIEKVLANQKGGGVPPLSDQAAFASSYGSSLRDSQVYGWVNTKSIVDTILKVVAKQGQRGNRQGGGPSPEKIMTAVGLTGLRTASFNVRDTPEGAVAGFNLGVPESERRGLFKIISFESKEASPPAFVPADAVKFTRVRFDLKKGLDTLENMLTEAIPQMAGFVKLIVDNAGKDKDPNFDLRKNLFANLGDDIITYQKAPRNQTLQDLSSPPTLFLIGSPKADQVSSAIRALGAVMPQPKVKEREFLGRTVYALNIPGGQGGKDSERALHYTASGGYVAMSTDVAMLEEFLRTGESTQKALRDTPGLAQAAQKIGGMNTGLFSYENQVETSRSAVEILKKESGSLASLFAGTPLGTKLDGEEGKKFQEWVDFSLLPSFDKLAKYFHFAVTSGNVSADGLGLKVFAPNPPQLKK